jgi:hypothetical protein
MFFIDSVSPYDRKLQQVLFKKIVVYALNLVGVKLRVCDTIANWKILQLYLLSLDFWFLADL